MRRGGRRFVSLRVKVMAVLLIAATLPMLCVGLLLYAKTISILTQKQHATSLGSLSAVGRNIQTIVGNVREISLQMIQDDDVAKLLGGKSVNDVQASETYAAVVRKTAFFISQKSYLDSIRLQNDRIVLMNAYSTITLRERASDDLIRTADLRKGGQVWIGDTQAYLFGEGSAHVISMIRNVNSIIKPSEKLGLLRIDIRESAVAALFEDDVRAYEGDVYLIDADGIVLSSSNRQAVGGDVSSFVDPKSIRVGSVEELRGGGKVHLVGAVTVEDTDWRLVSVMPVSVIVRETQGVRSIMTVCVAISAALCLLTTLLATRYFTAPILRLAGHMRALNDDHYKTMLTTRRNDEIGVLYDSFNEMSARLDQLINQVFEQKIHREDAELKALQAQINPHFLYNNLDTAYWMSRIEGADRTGEIVLALAKLFRLSIRNASQEIPVTTELEHIESYIVIQRIRFEDSVRFEIDAAEDALNLLTSRFVLQPLVENALNHGILPANRGGTVRVAVFREEENLVMTVSDDGVGGDIARMNALLTDENAGAEGLAIRNVHARIVLRCGPDSGLRFAKNAEGGITVTVRQSLIAASTRENREEQHKS